MHRTGSRVRTNEKQYELQTFPPFWKGQGLHGFCLLCHSFNIKKICAKMAKEGMDWLIGLFYELTVAIFRCCEHINRRNPQNIAA